MSTYTNCDELPKYTCPKCNGNGFVSFRFVKNNPNSVSVICSVCYGKGEIREDEFIRHV